MDHSTGSIVVRHHVIGDGGAGGAIQVGLQLFLGLFNDILLVGEQVIAGECHSFAGTDHALGTNRSTIARTGLPGVSRYGNGSTGCGELGSGGDVADIAHIGAAAAALALVAVENRLHAHAMLQLRRAESVLLAGSRNGFGSIGGNHVIHELLLLVGELGGSYLAEVLIHNFVHGVVGHHVVHDTLDRVGHGGFGHVGSAFGEEIKNARHAIVFNHETGEEKQYLIPFGFRVKVQEGQIIKKGDKITDGAVNPHDILAILGSEAVMNYLISEVQSTYRLQGVEINDKHIEVIVRQMMRKVRVEDAGDTKFMSGQTYDKNDVLFENEQIKKRIANGEENLREATFTQLLLGITKAALATDSFLSAASFQETTRVLTDAAIKGKIDPLIGLKENVIIGKVIPAGTGMPRYAGVKLEEPKSEVEDADENAVESTETADIAE